MTEFSKNSDFGENWTKISCLVKVSKSLDLFRNITISVQVSENLDFGQNIWKILIDAKIFEISWCQNFRNISILAKIQKKMAILVKLWKSWFWWIFSKYVDFGQNFRKYRLWTKFSKNPHFGQNCRKYRFWKLFPKRTILVKIRGY